MNVNTLSHSYYNFLYSVPTVPTSHSNISSTAINTNKEPKSILGSMEVIGMGIIITASSTKMMTMPDHRVQTPRRILKIV